MPKVNYTNTKGLYQEAGSGVNWSQGATQFTRKPISVTVNGSTTALTAADSGSVVSLAVTSAASHSATVTLPAGSTCATGTHFKFMVGFDSTGGYTIARGTDDEIFLGALTCWANAVDPTGYTSPGGSDDTLKLEADDTVTLAGGEGSTFTVMWDGAQWIIWGKLHSGSVSAGMNAVDIWTNT